MRLFSICILVMLFMPLFSGEVEKSPLPSSVVSAEKKYDDALVKLRQAYLKDVLRERNRLLQVIDREINRLRLSEDDEKVADKIVKTEDEKVKAALLAVASDEVKASLALKKKRMEVENVGATDILGNPIEPQVASTLLVGTWKVEKTNDTLTFLSDGRVTQGGNWEQNADGTFTWHAQDKTVRILSYNKEEKTWTVVRVADKHTYKLLPIPNEQE